MADNLQFYKLPLDVEHDQDLIQWIDSLGRTKKAEVIRHALRLYKNQLGEGEIFYYPPSNPYGQQAPVQASVAPDPVEEPVKREKIKPQFNAPAKKKPKMNLRSSIKNTED